MVSLDSISRSVKGEIIGVLKVIANKICVPWVYHRIDEVYTYRESSILRLKIDNISVGFACSVGI